MDPGLVYLTRLPAEYDEGAQASSTRPAAAMDAGRGRGSPCVTANPKLWASSPSGTTGASFTEPAHPSLLRVRILAASRLYPELEKFAEADVTEDEEL